MITEVTFHSPREAAGEIAAITPHDSRAAAYQQATLRQLDEAPPDMRIPAVRVGAGGYLFKDGRPVFENHGDFQQARGHYQNPLVVPLDTVDPEDLGQNHRPRRAADVVGGWEVGAKALLARVDDIYPLGLWGVKARENGAKAFVLNDRLVGPLNGPDQSPLVKLAIEDLKSSPRGNACTDSSFFNALLGLMADVPDNLRRNATLFASGHGKPTFGSMLIAMTAKGFERCHYAANWSADPGTLQRMEESGIVDVYRTSFFDDGRDDVEREHLQACRDAAREVLLNCERGRVDNLVVLGAGPARTVSLRGINALTPDRANPRNCPGSKLSTPKDPIEVAFVLKSTHSMDDLPQITLQDVHRLFMPLEFLKWEIESKFLGEHNTDTMLEEHWPGSPFGVWGCGKIGTGVIEALERRGVPAIGCDVNPLRNPSLHAYSGPELLELCDSVVICASKNVFAGLDLSNVKGVKRIWNFATNTLAVDALIRHPDAKRVDPKNPFSDIHVRTGKALFIVKCGGRTFNLTLGAREPEGSDIWLTRAVAAMSIRGALMAQQEVRQERLPCLLNPRDEEDLLMLARAHKKEFSLFVQGLLEDESVMSRMRGQSIPFPKDSCHILPRILRHGPAFR